MSDVVLQRMNERIPLVEIPDMPFTIGHQPEAFNPNGLPDRLPFLLEFDPTVGLIVQASNTEVERQLSRCYASGSLLGTAMDDTDFGRRYALDFFDFVDKQIPNLETIRSLEIGPGRGYLMRLLAERGADIIGVEPGVEHEVHWRRHGVRVLKGTFPHRDVRGSFDLILAFGVLEHIREPEAFLQAIRSHLSPGGMLAIAVPDCALAIRKSDPSILVHEHFSYFTQRALRRLFVRVGLKVITMQPAGYGSVIYCTVTSAENASHQFVEPVDVSEYDDARTYGLKCLKKSANIERLMRTAADEHRTIGIYCPARALNVLSICNSVRFFDDDPELTGRYYPPFQNVIENRKALIDKPVDELWIMSRTFGPGLAEELAKEDRLARTRILLVDQIFED